MRENFPFIRGGCALYRGRFAFVRESNALYRESFAFVREEKYFCTFKGGLNGLSYKSNKPCLVIKFNGQRKEIIRFLGKVYV